MHADPRPAPPRERDPASRRLALARDLIQRKRRPDALSVLAKLAPSTANPARKTKVAALLGDYEHKRGRFADAVAYHEGALAQLSAAEPRDWFRPALGRVRALLSQPAVDDAFSAALEAWARAKACAEEFSAQTTLSVTELRARKRLIIGPRPLRTSVVASRLGEAFFQAGESEMASFFFNEALLVNPRGSCRARQSLARLAMAAGDPATAEARSREALLVGKTQAKTIAVWPLLISARAAQKKPLFQNEDRALLRRIKSRGVRARAVLEVCRALRARGDDVWMDIATDWISRDGPAQPAICFEIEKLFGAEAHLAGVYTRTHAATALRLARSRDAAPFESIAFAKSYVRAGLLSRDATPSWRLLGRQIETRHNAKVSRRALHAMALGAIEAKQHALARTILRELRATTPPGQVQWARSTSALARMERALGRHAAASATYLEMAANPLVARRFRAEALILATRSAEAGNVALPAQDTAWFETFIATEKNHRTLLDLGRQLRVAPGALADLRHLAIERGTAMTEAELQRTEHPAPALALLLELNRRQYHDFGQSTRVLDLFESYARQRLDWLWSPGQAFWEWYSIIVLATDRRHGPDAALAIAQRYLDDPGTPPEGLALLATETGRCLIAAKRIATALVLFNRAISARPAAITTIYAHYWQALYAWNRNEYTTAKQEADNIRRAIGRKPALLAEWECDSRAALLIENLEVAKVLSEKPNLYASSFIIEQLERINTDLTLFK